MGGASDFLASELLFVYFDSRQVPSGWSVIGAGAAGGDFPERDVGTAGDWRTSAACAFTLLGKQRRLPVQAKVVDIMEALRASLALAKKPARNRAMG